MAKFALDKRVVILGGNGAPKEREGQRAVVLAIFERGIAPIHASDSLPAIEAVYILQLDGEPVEAWIPVRENWLAHETLADLIQRQWEDDDEPQSYLGGPQP